MRSEQVVVAVSPAEFGLRNSVFRHSAKSTKCMWSWQLSYSQSNHNLFCSLFPTLTCKFASPVPLISRPATRSLFQPLSLSSCYRGKQHGVAVETASREGSLWDFQCADRSLYMAASCLSTNRWAQPSMNIQPFNQTDGATDREAKRQRKERMKDGQGLDWSLDLAAAASSSSGRSIFVARCNPEHLWHLICAPLLRFCPPHGTHTLTHPLHHSHSQSSDGGQHSADEY